MASLRNRINRIFGRAKKQDQPRVLVTTLPSEKPSQEPMDLVEKFKAETERKAVIEECRKMYKTDLRIKKAFRMLAQDTMKGGFSVKTANAQAQAEADALFSRLGLNQKLERYVRLTPRDGDSFLQNVIDENMNIVSLTRKPTLRMRRNTDDADQFSDPSKAFWMADKMYWGMDPPKDVTWFAQWEIIHARWEWDEESRYGTPMFASGTGTFRKVTEGEIDMAVRRKTRAGMRYHHVIEGNASDVEAYKELNKTALNNPNIAAADFFSNKPGGINAVQGDANMDQIADVKHQIATLFAGSDVPMELVAYGEELNRDILGDKREEYEEILRQVREWTVDEILKPLLELQWLLKGILPDGLEYEIISKHATGLKAQDFLTITDAVLRMKILGIADEVIKAILEKQLGVDIGELIPQTDGETERFANLLKGLSV